MKDYKMPEDVFDMIKAFAEKEQLTEVLTILEKYDKGTISLDVWEVEIFLKIAELWRIKASLRYPFWEADHPKYSEEHAEKYYDAQEETWEEIHEIFPTAGYQGDTYLL